jgi:uncharacterized membrane protein
MTALATIARGDGSGIVEPRRSIVRDADAWRALWAAHAGPSSDTPVVDFDSHMVAAVFAGERPTPGFQIELTGLRREGTTLVVTVDERAPQPGAMAAQMIVTPFHIAALPRYDGEVRFAGAADPVPAAPPRARTTPPRDAPSSTGLQPNVAAALAYLAGPFSGVLILLVERANAFVRFHAWQSVVGLGGLGALAILALVTSFLTLLLSPRIFTAMYWLSGLMGCVWLVAWAVCLFQAFGGHAWHMPVAGRYAKRLASRS